MDMFVQQFNVTFPEKRYEDKTEMSRSSIHAKGDKVIIQLKDGH